MTLERAFERYFQEKARKRSLAEDRRIAEHLKASFGKHTQIKDLTTGRISAYRARRLAAASERRKGPDGKPTPLSAASINRPLALLRHLLRLAHEEWEALTDIPKVKNNGGPTQTIALLPISAAVNAIPVFQCTDINGTPITTDQRGVPRPQGPACDIGAFEFFQSRFGIEAVETFLIIDSVQSSGLPAGTQQGLIAPLQGAVDSMNGGDVIAATNQLGAFINHVNALVLNDTLTPAGASALTTPAQAVIQSLNSPAS